VIGVNLTGVFLVCRAGLRHMYRQGSGVLVLTSSPHALATVPDAAAYAASKGGVHALTRALALEAAPRGIRVNALVPGTIDTPMVHREIQVAADPGAQLARLAASHPLGRLGRPGELASVALFLASDAASFMTGTTVHADGGLMAALPSGPALPYNAGAS
jgi:NAD(P)-dependent dehydrogenase (short-subunit alcohol dehydrogenase family)